MTRAVATACFILCTLGCATQPGTLPRAVATAFEKADEVTLYSIDPGMEPVRPADQEAGKEYFHNYPVLGRIKLDTKMQTDVLDAFRDGVKNFDGKLPACFIPRHGLRFRTGDKTLDLVICFQCHSAEIYDGDTRTGAVSTSRSPGPAFNGVLKAANIPLATGAD